MKPIKILFLLFIFIGFKIYSQHSTHYAEQNSADSLYRETHTQHAENRETAHFQEAHATSSSGHIPPDGHTPGHHSGDGEFDTKAIAFHHISDLNVYSIGPWNFPLPCLLYAPRSGWSIFSSAKFQIDNNHHGSGRVAIDGYVLNHGRVNRIADPDFPKGEIAVGHITSKSELINGKETVVDYVEANGRMYKLDKPSTFDGGLFGGGITSFYDFSITKNVLAVFIVVFLLSWGFLSMARNYQKYPASAPRGLQLLLEPFILFIQDEIAKPILGHKHEKYLTLLIAFFFFILGLNLFGQIPFIGSANATGNLSVTMALALIAFLVINFSGNKHYWEHIFWMPGVPAWVKTILTPVEVLGVLIKPLTLMLRLFANITAGHLVIIVFISLIFIFGKGGTNPAGAYASSIASILLTLLIMAIELLVAFIQAYVFTLLTASFIGSAIEEHPAHDSDHH